MELAERMRQQNHEQFQTLVRMHLSFELDLHTDDNDANVPANGGDGKGAKFRRRFQFHKKPKAAPAAKGAPGAPMLSAECVTHMRALMEFLQKEHNIVQEGIFRRTGSLARQTELKQRVVGDSASSSSSSPLRLDTGAYTVHDCASVLKGVLADLPEPLLTDTYAPAHLQMAELCNSLQHEQATAAPPTTVDATDSAAKATRLLHALQLLILLLPADNRQLLREIIGMLHRTAAHQPRNKMSADSLATLFTPHLICPKRLTPEALHATAANLSGIISFMIARGAAIFECPPKLLTDIRAYFAEQRRKQTLSPQQVLDESVTSDSTANTVYTFVDRERTAQAHDQNPTDTCLAQLYAYIQSLPESSKKRKLISKFNKENGQGTPLQVQKLHRLKSGEQLAAAGGSGSASKAPTAGKSLGDSIKRHIFQKNLLARTPKVPTAGTFLTPGPTSSMAAVAGRGKQTDAFDTPTVLALAATTPAPSQPVASTPAMQPLKTRVLFQSPASTSSKASTVATPTPLLAPTPNAPETLPHHGDDRFAFGSSTISAGAPAATGRGDDDDDDESSTDNVLGNSEFELLSETITQLQQQRTPSTTPSSSADTGAGIKRLIVIKKTVAFGPAETKENVACNATPSSQTAASKSFAAMKARFRSEPNLTTSVLCENQRNATVATVGGGAGDPAELLGTPRLQQQPNAHPGSSRQSSRQSGGRYIANKLLKGVSMVNLMMLPSALSPQTTETTTTTLTPLPAAKSRPTTKSRSAERHPSVCGAHADQLCSQQRLDEARAAELDGVDGADDDDDEIEDIDDPDFVATPQSQRSSNCTAGSASDFGLRFSADAELAELWTPTTRSIGGGGGGPSHAAMLLMQQSQQSHHLHLQHHVHGRRSMSPITKSTQRMSKAMQESIMTPRSRKPVMLTGALLAGVGCGAEPPAPSTSATAGGPQSQQSTTAILGNVAVGRTNSFCSFREQDEEENGGDGDGNADTLLYARTVEELARQATPTAPITTRRYTTGSPFGDGAATLPKSRSEGDFGVLLHNSRSTGVADAGVDGADDFDASAAAGLDSLSLPFKNYLYSRSAASPPSPVDSSFSSQPDDFGSAPDDLDALAAAADGDTDADGLGALGDGADLSESLLFCLDGNQPPSTQTAVAVAACVPTLQRTASGSSGRKRTNGGAEDGADAAEQRQYFDDLHPKKQVMTTTKTTTTATSTATTCVSSGATTAAAAASVTAAAAAVAAAAAAGVLRVSAVGRQGNHHHHDDDGPGETSL